MKSNSVSSEQLALRFPVCAGLPFAVAPRRIRRQARQAIVSYPAESRRWFAVRGYLETLALLEQLRRSYRRAIRGGRAAAFACTPAGRRLHRTLEVLTARIAAEHAALCG